ncbi:MAG TPA: cyclase family protein [Actinomycetota bacterium]|nr:cyclase family protein [Actinomycetota bacterium]
MATAAGVRAGLVDVAPRISITSAVLPAHMPFAAEIRCPHAWRSPDGVNVLRVHIGSESGTPVDAPFHVLADGARLDELPLDRFIGPGVVADLRHLDADVPIGSHALEPVPGAQGPGAAAEHRGASTIR